MGGLAVLDGSGRLVANVSGFARVRRALHGADGDDLAGEVRAKRLGDVRDGAARATNDADALWRLTLKTVLIISLSTVVVDPDAITQAASTRLRAYIMQHRQKIFRYLSAWYVPPGRSRSGETR